MPIKKTVSLALIFYLSMMIALPTYAVKLVDEEEIKKPASVKELPPPVQKLDDSKQEDKEGRAPIENKEITSTVEKKSTQSEKDKDSQAPVKSTSWFWIWIVVGIVVLIILLCIMAAISAGGRQLEEEKEENERRKNERERRKRDLINKYGEDEGLKIFNETVWVGMTTEQLIDSVGDPDDIKTGFHNTGTFYYGEEIGPRGGITYRLAVKLKNDIVTDFKEN